MLRVLKILVFHQLPKGINIEFQRGGVLIQKWGRSSAASTAVSIVDAIRSLVTPTAEGDWFSSAVSSFFGWYMWVRIHMHVELLFYAVALIWEVRSRPDFWNNPLASLLLGEEENLKPTSYNHIYKTYWISKKFVVINKILCI